MAVDAGLTVGAAAAASLLWKVIRHILELTVKEVESAAVTSAKAQLGQAIKKLFRLKGEEEKAFEKAFGKARERFLGLPGPRLKQMEWLELLLDGKSPASEEFAEAAVQTYLFERPQAESRLPWLYQRVVTFGDARMPPWEQFEPIVVECFDLLREELRLSNDHYRSVFDSLAREALAKTVGEGERGPAQWVILTAPKLSEEEAEAARERYCRQLAERCQRLEFLGILTKGDERPIPLDEIFIELRVEQQVEEQQPYLELSFCDAVELAGYEVEEFTAEDQQTWEEQRHQRTPVTRKITKQFSASQALRDNEKLVLLGAPGSGKSTLARYLALIFARGQAARRLDIPEKRLPLLILLREYLAERARHSGDGFSFLDYLYCNAKEILNVDPPLPEGFFEHFLRQKKCLVLFDGLDEVTEPGERLMVRDAVCSFANAFPANGYLITSRPAGYEEAPLSRDDYPHFRILDFTDKEIEAFVTKWYDLRELSEREATENKESLLAAIKASPGVKRLAVNPLLLTIIALIHRQEAELPNQRVRLYDECSEVLLYRWERRKRLEWGIGPEEMRRRLEHIAFWMYEQGKVSAERAVSVEREELEWELTRFLRGRLPDPTKAADEARRFLDLVRERAGLLMELRRGLYSFVHLTFQEYFAAMDVIYRFYDELDLHVVREVVLGHLHEPAWREVSLLAVSKLKPRQATKLLREIPEAGSDYEDLLHRDLFFAARCMADDVEVDWELSQEILGSLVEIFRTTPLDPLREDIGKALAALRGSRYVPVVAESLQIMANEKALKPDLCIDAAYIMGRLGWTEKAIPMLLAWAQDKKVLREIRNSAVMTLGELGQADLVTVEGLLALAQDKEENLWVRHSAACALGELGKGISKVIGVLPTILQDEDNELRMIAASALLNMGVQSNEVIDLVASIMIRVKDRERQYRRGLITEDELYHERFLYRAPEIWIGASNYLKDAVSARLVAVLSDADVQRSALQALGELGRADQAAPALLALANDEKVNPLVRNEAASTLGKLGWVDEATSILLALANDENVGASVRRRAASILGQLGWVDEAASILLSLALEGGVNSWVRHSIALDLGQLGQVNEAALIFSELVSNAKADPGVRRSAASSLGELDRASEAAVNTLLKLALDEKMGSWLRLDTACALGKLGRLEQATSILLELACDEKRWTWVRCNAVSSLGELGRVDKAAINALLELVQDKGVELDLRHDAAFALGKLGRVKEAASTLVGLAYDEKVENWVRSEAYRALKELVGRSTD